MKQKTTIVVLIWKCTKLKSPHAPGLFPQPTIAPNPSWKSLLSIPKLLISPRKTFQVALSGKNIIAIIPVSNWYWMHDRSVQHHSFNPLQCKSHVKHQNELMGDSIQIYFNTPPPPPSPMKSRVYKTKYKYSWVHKNCIKKPTCCCTIS